MTQFRVISKLIFVRLMIGMNFFPFNNLYSIKIIVLAIYNIRPYGIIAAIPTSI